MSSGGAVPTWQTTSPFVPPIKGGYVIKVYDGDTITVAAKVPGLRGSGIYRFNVRLRDIDAPELRGETKVAGIESRNYLRNLVLGEDVLLKDVGTEKYGRLLAHVYIGEANVGQRMLDSGHAQMYGRATVIENGLRIDTSL